MLHDVHKKAKEFFDLILAHTMQGFYGDPRHGGNRDAVSCLMGKPATDEHVAICNNLVTSGSSLDKGKALAVATILAAAHSCE